MQLTSAVTTLVVAKIGEDIRRKTGRGLSAAEAAYLAEWANRAAGKIVRDRELDAQPEEAVVVLDTRLHRLVQGRPAFAFPRAS